VIPNLFEVARRFGFSSPVAALVFAALLTAFVFLAQSLASWFDDRDS
jgi:hypothetical protein